MILTSFVSLYRFHMTQIQGNISGLLEAELLSTGLLAHHGVSSSGSGGMDTLQILGKLNFRLKYNYEKRALTVTIERCSDLIFKESTHADHCDPYIKLQLLPEKQNKVIIVILFMTHVSFIILHPLYGQHLLTSSPVLISILP